MGQFASFFMGGYECADHLNRHGERINLLQLTRHHVWAREDYSALAGTGIKTVREGICWSMVEQKPGQYNFTEAGNRIKAAQDAGIQQIWDICHFGFPDDLYPTHPQFTGRFAALCQAFGAFYGSVTNAPLLVIPINEMSFLAWLAGEAGGTAPYAVNCGFAVKYHLCKAAIAGIKALRETCTGCTILLSEPLIHIQASHPHHTEIAREHHLYQYQVMDMITGKMCPELQGNNSYVDVLGVNYYHNCQWYYQGEALPWPDVLQQRQPLAAMLAEAYNRYNKPLVITETGHFGQGRAQWLYEITEQCLHAIARGVDLQGICLYPLLDRPDWDNLNHYHNSGLWDYTDTHTHKRAINQEYLAALLNLVATVPQSSQPALTGAE